MSGGMPTKMTSSWPTARKIEFAELALIDQKPAVRRSVHAIEKRALSF